MDQVVDKIRIIQLIDSISLGGGAERLVIDICKELQNHPNVEIKLVVLNKSTYYGDENEDLWEKKLPESLKPIVCSSMLGFSFLGMSRSITTQFDDFVEQFNPHIIHSHLLQSELISRNKIIEGIKYFTHFHDNMPLFRKFTVKKTFSRLEISNYFIKKWLIRKYNLSNNHFFSISKDTYTFYSQNLPKKLSDKIIPFPNAIDIKRFHLNPEKSFSKDKTINLLSIGSLVPKKNHKFLLHVVKKLLSLGYLPSLRILGDGSERINLETEIYSMKIQNFVTLLGYSDTVEEEVISADIYVHSATYEPFGISIVEAMAAGLPVICLNGRGNVSLIEEGLNGFLINKEDVQCFVEKIIYLKNNPNVYSQMSEYAKHFSKQFDIKIYVKRLLKVYQSIQ